MRDKWKKSIPKPVHAVAKRKNPRCNGCKEAVVELLHRQTEREYLGKWDDKSGEKKLLGRSRSVSQSDSQLFCTELRTIRVPSTVTICYGYQIFF